MSNNPTAESARTQALILAGGRGERLHPLTVSRPKPAVSFGGNFRIIDFTLSNCYHSGIPRLSLLTQCGHEELQQYVQSGWGCLWSDGKNEREPLRLLPPPAGKRYQGTADAVYQNSSLLQSGSTEFVLVLSGDHVYHMDYRDLLRQHAETNADLTIAAVEHPLREASQFGVIEVDEILRVTGFAEKPSNPRPLPARPSVALVSMGVYVFKKSVLLESLRECCETGLGYDFGHDIIPALMHFRNIFAYNFRDEIQDSPRYWRDIGTLDSYYDTSMDIVDSDSPFDPFANAGRPSEPTRHPVCDEASGTSCRPRLSRSCNVSRTVLSSGVHVESGALVTSSVLMPGVRIGKGARLQRTIVEEGVQIPAGFHAGFDIDVDRLQHTVTRNGVVVVSRTPVNFKRTISRVTTYSRVGNTLSYAEGLAAACLVKSA